MAGVTEEAEGDGRGTSAKREEPEGAVGRAEGATETSAEAEEVEIPDEADLARWLRNVLPEKADASRNLAARALVAEGLTLARLTRAAAEPQMSSALILLLDIEGHLNRGERLSIAAAALERSRKSPEEILYV